MSYGLMSVRGGIDFFQGVQKTNEQNHGFR